MRPFYAIILSLLIYHTAYSQSSSAADSLKPLSFITPETDDSAEEQYGLPVLSAYNDIYSQMATYNLMFVRYRNRGYDGRFTTLEFNGAKLADPYSGSAMWSLISGLNLVTRNRESTIGLSPTRRSLGGIGVSTDVFATPSAFSTEFRLNAAAANRTYNSRVMAMYSSEIDRKGWGYTVAASRYWGASPIISGVFSDSWAAFASVEKQFADGSSLVVTLLDSPAERGIQSAATAEAFSLTNYQYNPAWGLQDGRKRNAKVRNSHTPMAIINHSWRDKVNSVAMFRVGEQSYSALAWNNAANPYPDYYRYMPSFFDNPATKDMVTEMWRTDQSVSQIDWQRLYNENGGDTRAKYIVEQRVGRRLDASLSSTYNSPLFDGGINLAYSRSHNFKRIDDLLGAAYWLDIDQYAEHDEEVADKYQNDMQNPNRHVAEGDTFGYNYNMSIGEASAWGNFKYKKDRFSGYIGGSVGMTAFKRTGLYEKELFPAEASLGPSATLDFVNLAFKIGGLYHLSGKVRLAGNFAYMSAAPRPENAFIAPQIRNAEVGSLKNEEIMSAELVCHIITNSLRLRLAGYYTTIRHQTEVRSFYDDMIHRYADYVMTGIDERHLGLEMGGEVSLTENFTLLAAAAVGYHTYISDPTATEIVENTGAIVADNEHVRWSGYRIGGTPQIVGSAGFSYRTRSYWSLSMTANYFADNFINMNPIRRTDRVAENAGSDANRSALTAQERLSEGFTVDVFGGKSLRIAQRHIIGIYLNISNLLDNKNIRSGGYEQYRIRRQTSYDNTTLSPFPNKYYHALGRTFFITANYRF